MSKTSSWDDLRFFLAVLEEGSLSGAARRLGTSQPTVRTRIATLEESLGATLFTRSVNGLMPTEHARNLLGPAQTMAMASEQFMRTASAPLGDIAGRVRLSVPELMGIEVIPKMLRSLTDRHPNLQIELELSNLQANLLQHEVDIAVRTTQPMQTALVARKAASIPMGFFASEDYLARRGQPQTLEDLADHALIGPDRSISDLDFVETLGGNLSASNWILSCDNHPAMIAAARAGLGITITQAPTAIQDPVLRPVLPDVPLPRLETWIVTHEDLRHTPKIRAVFDSLVESFAAYK
ncbi:LysR family transcriptional regulator [uncultured Cohaesibacter sp.]|uniref:LysR family transcriptional regulator n=1 Tax=uncultured Cohaesibacter sp. TaxID=1002546 RepID=UPI0029C74F19|nr:LysR family transcriptional regulator [uncultured Cohaesibacter sp.]